MAWLKTVGCECPECGPDPCTSGCDCGDGTFIKTDHGTGTFSVSYDSTGKFCNACQLDLSVTLQNDLTSTRRFVVKADGVTVYDSGCVTVLEDDVTVSVDCPISIEITLTACIGDASAMAWSYLVDAI